MQTMILASQDQLKNLDNVGAVLIYPSKITTSGLIQSATSNDLVVNCIVDDDPDNAFIGQSLSQLGYPSGCYIVINYQSKKDVKDITGVFSNNLQLGYRAAIIINKSDYSQDDLKTFKQYGVIVIDHTDVKDNLLNVPELLTSRSLAMVRDYTNVDIADAGPGAYVGIGKDTSGLGGGRSFGYSTNGQDFYAVITPKGLVFRQIDALRMWRLLKPQQAAQIGDFFNNKVAKEIEAQNESLKSAVATATSAVNAANQAVNDSKVNSDAIKAMNSAIAAAQDDANSAAAAIQEVRANASSDAASIRSDVAKIESEVASAKFANQDSVNALQSDIDAAKKDLADAHSGLLKVQAAVEQNQKLINDSVAKINNDINQDRKDMAEAQQANDDMAKKLNSYTNQAKEQGKTIEKLQTDDNGMKLTIADVKGNVSQVQDSVTGLTANLKDANDNLATIKALANSLSVTMTDHSKNINDLQVTAKKLSSILSDADGRLSKVEQTAKEHTSTFSDVQGNISQVKQTADGLADTLKDAQGNIDKVRATAKGLSEQISNAQGDITALQTDVSGIKATIADHEKNIHTLQVDSKSLTDNMTDAQGNISKFQKTATDLTSELQDHAGRISKVEQTASTLTNEFSDQDGRLSKVEQTATGTQQTVANQQGQINSIQTDVSGIHETITGQSNQIANLNVTLNGLNTKYEGVSGDLNKLKSQAQWVTVTSAVDLNNVKTPCHEFLKGTVTNAPNETAWWYLTVEGSESGRITQTVIADQSNNRYTRRWADGWSAWVKDATQTDVTALSNRITTNSTQITQNQQAIALKADQATVDNLSGEVSQNSAQLKVQADQISSKVSSTDFKTLNDKVNGMQIGTSNLLHHSDTFDGWSRNTTVTISSEKYLNGNIAVLATNGSGSNNLSSSLDGPYDDQPVTWTVWAKADNAGDRLHTELWGGGGLTDQPLTTNWKLYKFTGHRNINYHDLFFWGVAGNKGKVYIALPFAVVGNTIGTWSPNPSDTITAIQKNSTAIDQTNKQISLKADQTEVDKIKGTAIKNSSRLDVMDDEIKSKVTSTDVNNIVDGKGYATTSTVQSLITQKAGTISESITNLEQTVKQGAENNVELVRKSDFSDGKTGDWHGDRVSIDVGHEIPAELGNNGMKILKSTSRDVSEDGVWYSVKPGDKFDVDFWMYPPNGTYGQLGLVFVDANKGGYQWIGVPANSGSNWVHRTGNIVAPQGSVFAKPWFQIEKDANDTKIAAWLAKPSIRRQNATTVAAIQQITASIDGLQSTVANKADTSQITQLSNLIQSKVSSNDFTSKISQLSNDINARVSKGDLISQLNMEAGQTLIQSNKLFLDADTIVFSKNSKAFIPDAAIENLSLDKLTTGHITVPIADKYGNQIELGNDGINVSSALEPIDWSGSGTSYQDDKSRFNFNVSSHGMSFTNHIEYGKSTVKTHASDDYQFLNLTPDVLHYTNGSTDQVKVPSGMTMYVPVNATSTLGPKSPGGFFAIGHEQIGDNGATSDKTIDIAYVAKQINGWKQGLHVNTTIYSKPAGASHNMRTAWVSWSNWDAGEHYPAIISDGKWWGGICFPSTGKVTLFDPYGHAMWLTQGNTPYSAWGNDYYS